MRPIDAVVGQAWAIQPEWLAMIAAVAQRQFDAPVVAAMQDNPRRAGQSGLTVIDGVAVIGLIGPIFPRANMMTEMSGATSLSKVRGEFMAAMADPSVKSIVFNVDSPGGVVTGIGDFAAEVAAWSKRKPVNAVATGVMASAAYWIASSATRIVVSPTALVGSIGVATAQTKQVAPDEKGRIEVEIVSSNAPNKRTDPTDSAGRAEIVARLDAIEAEFIKAVAANRGVSVDKVKADFGRGGVVVGAAALAAGMADKIGTLDSVLAELTAVSPAGHSSTRAAAAATAEKASMSTITTLAELKAAHPDLVGQLRSELLAAVAADHTTALANARSDGAKEAVTAARAEGAKGERERILGIEALGLKGHEKLVAELKADGVTTPAEAAIKIVQAEKAAGGTLLTGLAADGKAGAAAAAGAEPSGGAGFDSAAVLADTTRSLEDRCKAAFEGDAALRTEFGSLETLVAYQRATESGQAKIFKPKR